jgi:hypothetical protein
MKIPKLGSKDGSHGANSHYDVCMSENVMRKQKRRLKSTVGEQTTSVRTNTDFWSYVL